MSVGLSYVRQVYSHVQFYYSMGLRECLQDLQKVIERDSKFSTYKFALLRGVTDIIQDKSPFIAFHGESVEIPLGLLVEKWIIYYYPLLSEPDAVPQIHKARLAFQPELSEVIDFYRRKGGLSFLFNDLRRGQIPAGVEKLFLNAARKIAETIVKQPMRYIGNSLGKGDYSIFRFEKSKPINHPVKIDIHFLISRFGSFYFPTKYYETLDIFGGFFNGYESLLIKWADFSVRASEGRLLTGEVVNRLVEGPVTERDAKNSRTFYSELLQKEGFITCVWSGQELRVYDVDHIIPFSIWKNNDLWNLMPSSATVNNRKRDKIPDDEQLLKSQTAIYSNWKLLLSAAPERFKREIEVALIGRSEGAEWCDLAFKKLREVCHHLITDRGFESWRN